MAYGVDEGRQEDLEGIANNQRRFHRLFDSEGLLNAARIEDMTYWVNNPTQGNTKFPPPPPSYIHFALPNLKKLYSKF